MLANATAQDVAVLAGLFIGVFLLIFVFVLFDRYFPSRKRRRQLHYIVRLHMKPEWFDGNVHEKDFPAYDFATLSRVVSALVSEHAIENEYIGAPVNWSTSALFTNLKTPLTLLQTPLAASPLQYERLPVALDQDASFPTNPLWFCHVRVPGAEGKPESAMISLTRAAIHADPTDGFDDQVQHMQVVKIGIACVHASTADWFFRTIEKLRRDKCIFRGKVIDPVIGPGGIQKIAFRKLKEVGPESLVITPELRDQLDRSIVGFYRHADRLRAMGVEMKRCVLMHGPPGTGKTSLSLHLASMLPSFTLCFVSGKQLLFPREICRMARYLHPSIVVFEDIDLIAEQRDTNSLATVLGELMNQFDGCEPDEQVFFIMNTNSLERLEAAVRDRPGRVDQIIELPPPGAELRRQMIEHFIKSYRLRFDKLDAVVAATRGATPALLREIVKRAAVAAVERVGTKEKSEGIEVVESDLLLACSQVRASRSRPDGQHTIGFRRDGEEG